MRSRAICVAVLSLFLAGAGHHRHARAQHEIPSFGTASWYGPHFHGRRTASGRIFDQWRMTAASRHLPLRSCARVTNLRNMESVRVRITDRGPYAHGRALDMSRAAARELGFERNGTAPVAIQAVPCLRPWSLIPGPYPFRLHNPSYAKR